MLKFLKRKNQEEVVVVDPQQNNIPAPSSEEEPKKNGFFKRLTQGLQRTRQGLTKGLANLVLGKKSIDDDLLEELETHLLAADIGVNASQKIIQQLTERLGRKQLNDSSVLLSTLKEILLEILQPCQVNLEVTRAKPYVILMVGINGAGKTTTIGKLAKKFQEQGKRVLLAAGDTFRAAAVEQLQIWGERNQIAVIAQHSGSDSASVIYDAIQAAHARKMDVVIADTAGRLHTQHHLMAELQKIKRVMAKFDAAIPHEVMLVLDAGIGQNALVQARQFHEAIGVTGITLTKLDGTAKGGIIFAIAEALGLPLRFIGVGESIDDLREFNAHDFVDALFTQDEVG
ncbi:MAG: signal recognition particle-docking protein FtsY [Legionellales bacterium]|nr:signal recognition particle-docking protein FtsY [Legionellales bacterium]